MSGSCRLCVRLSICPSVCPSARPSVAPRKVCVINSFYSFQTVNLKLCINFTILLKMCM